MPDISKFLDAVYNLGVAGGPVFCMLYLLERADRRRAQDTATALLRESVTATKESAVAIDRIADHNDEVRAGIAKVAEAVTLLTVRRTR